jgi:hypothetical protein
MPLLLSVVGRVQGQGLQPRLVAVWQGVLWVRWVPAQGQAQLLLPLQPPVEVVP